MTPAFSEALAGLQPRQRGRGWVAKCPAHEDTSPSLNVDEADGKVLLKCQAGCDTRDVLTAIGLQMTDLFDPEPEPVGEPRIVATYDYTDEGGQLLFQVVRYDPKRFKQRRPLPGDRWGWNLDGVDRVPYRLPEVAAATDVVIVEGEKDVETLRGLGLVATCNMGGAGNWRHEWGPLFAGKRVTIIPDNDDPGRKHAAEVHASVSAHARKATIVELPGSPPKGDVSAWLANGHTPEDLRALLRPSIAPTLGAYIDSFGGNDTPDLYQDIVPAGGLVVFVGQPRSFKTMAALQMMFSVASGQRWLGHDPTRTGSCLYVSEEGSRRKVADRLIAMRDAYRPEADIHILHREGITLGAPSWDRVRATLDEMEQPQLVVLDTLAALMTGDENSVADIREALRPIQKLITDYGVTVALVHHINKGGEGRMGNRMRGSSALWGACDGTLGFVRDEDNDIAQDTGEVRVETKDNDPKRIRFGFHFETMTLKADVRPQCNVPNLINEVAARQAETHAAVPIEEVRDYFGVGKSWFYQLVKEAEASGLERTAKGYYKVAEGMFR